MTVMTVHPTARIAEGAELGRDVEIGPYCVVGPRVRLGDRCRLDSHVVVDGDTVIGADCRLFPFSVIGATPQDKKIVDPDFQASLRIGSHNVLREHVTIHGGTHQGEGVTRIGDHNMFLVGSHVGHDSQVGSHIVFTNGAMLAGHTVVCDRVTFGAMVGVHQFTRVGEMAMIGAGAMLSRDAPPYALIQGDRARLVGVNVVGLHRADFPPETTAAVKRAYRLLFWRTGTLTERIEAIRKTDLEKVPAVRRVLEFVMETRRGVCSARNRRLVPGEEQATEA